jgi:Arc/MetJ-type ribon-helix-helix transcriptional regulator
MNKKAGHPENQDFIKFSICLSEETELFLDKLKTDIREKGGARLSRSEIIRAAIRYVKVLKPDLSGIKNEEDLLNSLIAARNNI